MSDTATKRNDATSGDPHRPVVFVSFAWVDTKETLFQRLIRDLKNDPRIRLWYPPDELRVGDSVIERISPALAGADFHLYVVPNSEMRPGLASEFLFVYTDQLRNQRAKLAPVLIHDGPVPDRYAELSATDLRSDYESRLERLVQTFLDATKPAIIQFELDRIVERAPIIEVTGFVGSRLIEYFAKHPDEMTRMDRRKFEELVAELFDGFGYEVELTKQTRDGGRDVIAIRRNEVLVKYLIECKRPDHGHTVGIRPVRELYAVKVDERATKAILATTARFSRDALIFFENHRWELEPRDYAGLLNWIYDYLQLRRRLGMSGPTEPST